jgi:hypothetical protein
MQIHCIPTRFAQKDPSKTDTQLLSVGFSSSTKRMIVEQKIEKIQINFRQVFGRSNEPFAGKKDHKQA